VHGFCANEACGTELFGPLARSRGVKVLAVCELPHPIQGGTRWLELGHDETPTGADHPCQLGETRRLVPPVVRGHRRHCCIDRCIGEGNLLDGGLEELDVGAGESAIGTMGGTNVVDYVAHDGSNMIAITCDVDDIETVMATLASPPDEMAATMQRHGVVPPLTAYVER